MCYRVDPRKTKKEKIGKQKQDKIDILLRHCNYNECDRIYITYIRYGRAIIKEVCIKLLLYR